MRNLELVAQKMSELGKPSIKKRSNLGIVTNSLGVFGSNPNFLTGFKNVQNALKHIKTLKTFFYFFGGGSDT